MSLISKPYTFSAGTTIIASEHNSNADTIYSDYDGNITNANISGSAAIAYSKLSLTNSILNADINSSAAIVASKLDLTSPGAIGSTSPSTGAFTTLKVGTTNQGDILYDNGTSLIRLTPGISGQFLETLGAAANPLWATIPTPSNVIFSWLGYDGGTASAGDPTNNTSGLWTGTACLAGFAWACNTSNSANTVQSLGNTFRWVKIAGVSTLTAYIRAAASNTDCVFRLDVNAGGLVSNKTLTGGGASTFTDESAFTLDVSSLTNGTAYVIRFYGYATTNNQRQVKVSSIMILGS